MDSHFLKSMVTLKLAIKKIKLNSIKLNYFYSYGLKVHVYFPNNTYVNLLDFSLSKILQNEC